MIEEPLSLKDLNTFVAVVEAGGIALAAERLGCTQPAVSLQLQRLARRLSVTLFERQGRKLVLTVSGYNVLERARALLRDVRAFERDAAQSAPDRETLAVAAIEPTASSKLAGVLAHFRRQSPNVDIRMQSLGGDAIAKAAQARMVQAALTVPTQLAGWEYEPLFTERLVLLARSDHRFANQRSVSLSRVAEERLLMTDDTCVYRRAVERAMARQRASAVPSIETSSLLTLPAAVAAGLGVAIVPRNVAGLERSELRAIPIREPIEITIGLLRPKAVSQGSALDRFISAAYYLRH